MQPYYNLSQAYTCSGQAQFLLPGHLKTPNRIENELKHVTQKNQPKANKNSTLVWIIDTIFTEQGPGDALK